MDTQTKIATKLRVMELERDNFTHFIIFDSTNDFAKLAGHSAIFYAAHFAHRIGRRCHLRHDDDYYSPSLEGIVSIKYNPDLLSRFAAINLTLDPALSTNLIHAFRFTPPFTLDDPTANPTFRCPKAAWRTLPSSKSLFSQPPGRGIVIGNLTSQLLSNIYLDQLDRFITFTLGYHHYGRYVDDFFIVVPLVQKPQLLRDLPLITSYLTSLGLTLHPKK